MSTLEVSLKAIEDEQQSDKEDALDVLLDHACKYEHVSAFEGVPDGSSEGTPTSEVEIKGVLEVTIELQMKMRMMVRLVVQKNSQNNSIKKEL